MNNRQTVHPSPYLKACYDGDLYLVKKHLDKLTSAQIENIRDENKASCAHYAARKGHVKILEYLIVDKKVNPNVLSTVGATILHDAAANGRIEAIEWILKKTAMKINTRDVNGAMALHLAAKYAQKGFIQWYFRYFDVDDANLQTINGTTPLHFACASGSYPCVQLIASVAPGAVNMKTKHGLTPLYLAVQGKYLEIVKLLVNDFKANIYERDNDGWSLLHVACQNGCMDVLKWLIDVQSFDINDRDAAGATGLHYCCSNGHPSLVLYLLSRNAKILVDNDGGTPLHDCAANNEIECARLLLTNDTCDVNTRDRTQLTAYDIALANGFTQLASEIKLLKDKSDMMANAVRKTDSVDSRYIDIDAAIVVTDGSPVSKERSSSIKSETASSRRSRSNTNEQRDSSGKYYIILEEKVAENLKLLDRIIDEYDDVDNSSDIGSPNGQHGHVADSTDTDTSSYIDLNNPKYFCHAEEEEQQVTHQASLDAVDYEAEHPSSNRSTWFPTPPLPEEVNVQYRDRSNSIENARLSTNTITNSSASPTLSLKGPIPEAPRFNINEADLKQSIVGSRKESIKPNAKRELSFVTELNSRIVNKMISLKKVPSFKSTVYQSYGDEQQQQEVASVNEIPPWKKELLERKKENKEETKKSEQVTTTRPLWMTELALKKKEKNNYDL